MASEQNQNVAKFSDIGLRLQIIISHGGWNRDLVIVFSFNLYLLILEKEEGGGREWNINLLLYLSMLHSLVDSCMCPDGEPQP